MLLVRSFLFNFYFVCLTSILSMVLLPFLILPASWLEWIPRMWITATLGGLKVICGISFEVQGKIPSGPCLIASNHQSTFETLVFHKILKSPVFIVKKELLFIPLIGWYLTKMGMIPVNRSRKNLSIRSLTSVVSKKISQGHCVIIFPEGRRVLPDQHSTFKPGIASFYTLLNQSVTPVVTNSGSFWSRRSFIKYPGKIIINFLEPIEPGLLAKPFLAQLQQTIYSHLSLLTNKDPQ